MRRLMAACEIRNCSNSKAGEPSNRGRMGFGACILMIGRESIRQTMTRPSKFKREWSVTMQRQLPARLKGGINCRQEDFGGCTQMCEVLGDGPASRPWLPGELLLGQPGTELRGRSVDC